MTGPDRLESGSAADRAASRRDGRDGADGHDGHGDVPPGTIALTVGATGGAEAGGTATPPSEAAGATQPRAIGARAVRVSLAPASAVAGADPLIVEPGTDPGTILLDGDPIVGSLDHLGEVRRRLSRIDPSGSSRVDLLVMPPTQPGSGPAVPPPGVTRREVVVDGWRVEVDTESEPRARLRDRARRAKGEAGHGGPVEVRAIIPGRIVSVVVTSGEAVEAGQKVLVLEAMKMQNELRAPRDGTVGRIAVAPGETVEVGDILLVIE